MLAILRARIFTFGLLLICVLITGCVTEATDEGTGEAVPEVDHKANEASALNDYITLANGYMKDGKRASALTAINKGLAIDDESPELLNVLAYYYMTDGEDNLAEKTYKKAISADSTYTASYLNYGVFLYQHKRYEEACDTLKKATEDVMYVKRDAAFLNYGICLKHEGKLAEAEEAFRRSYVNDARNPLVVLEMADLKFEAGEFDQSLKLYDRFLSMSKQTPKSVWLGIRLMRVLGHPDKEASYALYLKNEFPSSPQYAEYKAWSQSK